MVDPNLTDVSDYHAENVSLEDMVASINFSVESRNSEADPNDINPVINSVCIPETMDRVAQQQKQPAKKNTSNDCWCNCDWDCYGCYCFDYFLIYSNDNNHNQGSGNGSDTICCGNWFVQDQTTVCCFLDCQTCDCCLNTCSAVLGCQQVAECCNHPLGECCGFVGSGCSELCAIVGSGCNAVCDCLSCFLEWCPD